MSEKHFIFYLGTVDSLVLSRVSVSDSIIYKPCSSSCRNKKKSRNLQELILLNYDCVKIRDSSHTELIGLSTVKPWGSEPEEMFVLGAFFFSLHSPRIVRMFFVFRITAKVA